MTVAGIQEITKQDIARLAFDMANLISSGVPHGEILKKGLLRETVHALRDALDVVLDSIRNEGLTFTQSFALRPDVFPADFLSALHVYEMSGSEESLIHYAAASQNFHLIVDSEAEYFQHLERCGVSAVALEFSLSDKCFFVRAQHGPVLIEGRVYLNVPDTETLSEKRTSEIEALIEEYRGDVSARHGVSVVLGRLITRPE